jgi:sulfate transport system substrate-binding protein
VKPEVPPPSQAQPLPPKLFTMADLGGWAKLEDELYSSKGLWTAIAAERSQARGR